MKVGDTVRWECWDSRDAPQEVRIVGYSDEKGIWEIETKNGVRWFVGSNDGTLFSLVVEGKVTTVVHCKKEPYDIYIGRGSKWGNPFRIGVHGDRAEVIRKYEDWIYGNQELLDSLHELRGKRLGCYCAPKPCHGNILAELCKMICGGHDDKV